MYQKGRIYRLIDDNTGETLLIGSTTMGLRQKLSEFKYNYTHGKSVSKYKDFYDRIGSENINIELIQRFPCDSKEELQAKEQEIRRSYKKAQHNTIS